jgi:hypothetical protein
MMSRSPSTCDVRAGSDEPAPRMVREDRISPNTHTVLEIGWADSLAVFFKVVANNPVSVYAEGFFKKFSNFSGVGQKSFKKFQKVQIFFKLFFLLFAQNIKKKAFQRILRRRKISPYKNHLQDSAKIFTFFQHARNLNML